VRLELKRRKTRVRPLKYKAFMILLLFFCVVAAAFSLFSIKTMPMLREVAQSELESIAFDIVGRAVEYELERKDEDYGNIVNMEYDNNGKVSAVTADMQKLNLLKLRIANRLSKEMFERTVDTVKIPVGNLSGIDFLTGLGPDICFKILWVSSVNSDFSNSFESAGVNQTKYRIMLDFSINVGMMLVGREVGVDVGTSVCVAETVIVGNTPDFFVGKQ